MYNIEKGDDLVNMMLEITPSLTLINYQNKKDLDGFLNKLSCVKINDNSILKSENLTNRLQHFVRIDKMNHILNENVTKNYKNNYFVFNYNLISHKNLLKPHISNIIVNSNQNIIFTNKIMGGIKHFVSSLIYQANICIDINDDYIRILKSRYSNCNIKIRK